MYRLGKLERNIVSTGLTSRNCQSQPSTCTVSGIAYIE
jgi:hypothetical protein